MNQLNLYHIYIKTRTQSLLSYIDVSDLKDISREVPQLHYNT